MKHELIIGGNFTVPRGAGMISARGVAEAHEWYPAIGKSGRVWLYHPQRSGVWVSGGPGSRGCGGSPVEFKLATGDGSIKLVGPWHASADACFEDTGIDVRDNFVTWGCVGTGQEYDGNSGETRITGLVWFDPEPAVGAFDRVDLIAWEMQEAEPDKKLFMYWESEGGSSNGSVDMPYKIRVARGLQKPITF